METVVPSASKELVAGPPIPFRTSSPVAPVSVLACQSPKRFCGVEAVTDVVGSELPFPAPLPVVVESGVEGVGELPTGVGVVTGSGVGVVELPPLAGVPVEPSELETGPGVVVTGLGVVVVGVVVADPP